MKEYPTDEELNLFIEQMEEQELYAPRHLKEEIMNRAFPKQTGQAQPKNKSGISEPVTLLTYRLKIIAGMAAALIMLMLIPVRLETGTAADDAVRHQMHSGTVEDQYWNTDGSGVNSVNGFLNEGTRRIDDKINSWLGITEDDPLNGIFEMNGGIFDEN